MCHTSLSAIARVAVLAALVLSCWHSNAASAADETKRTNVIFILADDLGYGDLGCFGQKIIQTPRIDAMAARGMRLTQFYAGSTVCAPSRSVLMTGQHTGHTSVRGNAAGPRQSLHDEDVTVAEVFKKAGYKTALIGKWGLGENEHAGRPDRQGFDYTFGYLNQHHAHNYWTDHLWRNGKRVDLRNVIDKPGRFPGGGSSKVRVDYTHDLFADDALRYIREHKDDPFFLFLALTIPHANNEGTRDTGDGAEVPDYGPYADKDWSNQDKGQAAMITRMDKDVGRILDLLTELGIDKHTLVIFTSDNGHHNEAGHNPKRFDPNGPLRGMKRDLYEGGIRVPTVAWQPGVVPAGSTSDHIAYFGDLLATAAEIAGVGAPEPNDSISFMPTLRGEPKRQKQHDYLFWEFYERRGARAVRQGQWKAVRTSWHGPIELYDLEADLGETKNIAADHPDIVKRMADSMESAHTDDKDWPTPKKR